MPQCNWDAQNMYMKLLNFKLKVTPIIETRAHEINDEEKVPVVKTWLGSESVLLIETFSQEEKEK